VFELLATWREADCIPSEEARNYVVAQRPIELSGFGISYAGDPTSSENKNFVKKVTDIFDQSGMSRFKKENTQNIGYQDIFEERNQIELTLKYNDFLNICKEFYSYLNDNILWKNLVDADKKEFSEFNDEIYEKYIKTLLDENELLKKSKDLEADHTRLSDILKRLQMHKNYLGFLQTINKLVKMFDNMGNKMEQINIEQEEFNLIKEYIDAIDKKYFETFDKPSTKKLLEMSSEIEADREKLSGLKKEMETILSYSSDTSSSKVE
jgi:hypothetical protein